MTATQRLIDALLAERERQDAKWGIQNHPFIYPGSQRDAAEYRKQAEFWKSLNDHRVRKQTERGIPADQNCAWDGIILEEIYEGLAEERPGLQYAELLQATAVGLAMLDKLDRDSREDTGHSVSCPAVDVDGTLTAIELCDCAETETLVQIHMDGSPACDADPWIGVLLQEQGTLVVRPKED